MKLGVGVPDGVSGGLERCGRAAETGIQPLFRNVLSKRTS